MNDKHINFFVYRNCFTNAVSGGDIHTEEILYWINKNQKNSHVFLIHPKKDGQENAYLLTKNMVHITYPEVKIKNFAFLFIFRSILGAFWVKIPKYTNESRNIFIASSHFLPDVFPVLIKSLFHKNVVTVVYIHHIVQDMPRVNSLKNFLANVQEKICFFIIRNYFNKIILVNKATKIRLLQRGFYKSEILISSNPIHIPKDNMIIKFNEKNFFISFCGRMILQKGIYDFLDLCKKLQLLYVDFSAVMIGTGPELDEIKMRVKKNNLNVLVTGYINDLDKIKYLSNSKLFVFPSIEEGWGIAIAEAMSLGVPVVAYDLPIYKEIFGNHLFTSPIRDVKKLLVETQRLLVLYKIGTELYKQKQNDIMQYISQFSIDTIAKNEYAYYTKN